jgi:hypothetical protein
VAEGSQEDAKFTPRLQIRSRIGTALDQYLDPEKVAGAYTDIQYYKHDGKVYVEVLFHYTDGQKIGPKQRKQFLVNKDFTLTPIKKQGMAEGATVTRIDSKPITDFGSSIKAYKHTDDWSQSSVDTGDDSYWKNKNLKTNTTKGLFAGDPKRTALYATGNAHETRYVEFTQNGQPIVYFDRKDLPAMRSRKTYLTVFNAGDFRQLPTGEWFSENPGKPIKQVPIGDPFKYIADQGWIVRVTDDLDKVFKQVKNMHKAGKIAHYGAEGMNESKQGVAEGLKSMYHNAVAKHYGRKADDAFDNGDEEGFKKSMDKNISHKLKAGEKIPQVRDPKKFQQGVAEDWNKVNHHDKTNGLSQKAVNAYRREHPGSKLKTAVTTKPSKLKPGSKAAKRRKSFCARMSGNKGPMKKPNGKPTPKALALRRWNCESIEEMQQLIQLGETYINNIKEKMMPSSTFTGSKKNKINGKGMLRNGPARPGDLVGGS